MKINDPRVVSEVEAVHARYNAALVANNVATLNELFWQSPLTVRYGVGENLYGSDEIAAFRAARSPEGLARRLSRTVITTYGEDFATASTLLHRDNAGARVGRQMQTWVRFPEGWRIVAAHVSMIDAV